MTKPTQAQIEAAAEAIFCHEIEEGLTIARERGPHHDAMAKTALTAAAEVGDDEDNIVNWMSSIKRVVANAEAATIERCAQVAHERLAAGDNFTKVVAAIRALKDKGG